MPSNKILSDEEITKMDIPLKNIIKRADRIAGWARSGAEVPVFWFALMNLIVTEKLDLPHDLNNFLSNVQLNSLQSPTKSDHS